MIKNTITIVVCLTLLIMAFGCEDELFQEGTAHQMAAKEVNDGVEETLGVSVQRSRTKVEDVDSDMCEGEQATVSMMLNESGKSPNFDDYKSVQVADVKDDEGNTYKIIYLNKDEVVVPERYK